MAEYVPLVGSWLSTLLTAVLLPLSVLLGLAAVGVVDLHVFVFGSIIHGHQTPSDLERMPPESKRFLFEFRLWLHVVAIATTADNVAEAHWDMLRHAFRLSSGKAVGFFYGTRILTAGLLVLSPLFTWIMCGTKWFDFTGPFRMPWPKRTLVEASRKSAALLYTYLFLFAPVTLIWSVCAFLPDAIAPSWLRRPLINHLGSVSLDEHNPELMFTSIEPALQIDGECRHEGVPQQGVVSNLANFNMLFHFLLCLHFLASIYFTKQEAVHAFENRISEASTNLGLSRFAPPKIRFLVQPLLWCLLCGSVVLGLPGVLWIVGGTHYVIGAYRFASVVLAPPAVMFLTPKRITVVNLVKSTAKVVHQAGLLLMKAMKLTP